MLLRLFEMRWVIVWMFGLAFLGGAGIDRVVAAEVAHYSFNDAGNGGVNLLNAETGAAAVVRNTAGTIQPGRGNLIAIDGESSGAVTIPKGQHLALPVPTSLVSAEGEAAKPWSVALRVRVPSLGVCSLVSAPADNLQDTMVFCSAGVVKEHADATGVAGSTCQKSGEWQTFVCSFDSGCMTVFCDGVRVLVKQFDLATSRANLANAGGYLLVGADNNDEEIAMDVDDIRVFDEPYPRDVIAERGLYNGRNLIFNGGFEIGPALAGTSAYGPAVSDGTAAPTGWTLEGTSGLAKNGTTWISTRNMVDGVWAAYIQKSEGALVQTFTVPEGAGGDYRLSFSYIARNSFVGERVNVLVDGRQVGYVTAVYSAWTPVEFSVPLEPGEHTLRFQGDQRGTTSDMAAAIDAVSLELPAEPARTLADIYPQTLDDYAIAWLCNGANRGETIKGSGFSGSAGWAVRAADSPDALGGATAINYGYIYHNGFNADWTVAMSFRLADIAQGAFFTLGKSKTNLSLEFYIASNGSTGLQIGHIGWWNSAKNSGGAGAVTVGVPELTTRFHTLAVAYHREYSGAKNSSGQVYEVYLDGVHVTNMGIPTSWNDNTYSYASGGGILFGDFWNMGPWGGINAHRKYDVFQDVRYFNRAFTPADAEAYARLFPSRRPIGQDLETDINVTEDTTFETDPTSGETGGILYIPEGVTVTMPSLEGACYNYGTLVLTGDATVSKMPFGPGRVKFTGSQTLTFAGLGNQPVELDGALTIPENATPVRYRSSPLTVSGGTLTLGGKVFVGDIADTQPTWGSTINVTDGTVSGGYFYLGGRMTENDINISGGTFTSGVRPYGTATQTYPNHRVNVTGGTFAPSSLLYDGGSAPKKNVSLVVNVNGGEFVPPTTVPGYIQVNGTGPINVKQAATFEADVAGFTGTLTVKAGQTLTLPAYLAFGGASLVFENDSKIVLDLSTFDGESAVLPTGAEITFPEGKTAADLAEFVEFRNTLATPGLSMDGKTIVAVSKSVFALRHVKYTDTTTRANWQDLMIAPGADLLPKDTLDFMGNSNSSGDKVWAATYMAGAHNRVDGWVNVTPEQAGTWTISGAYDDYVGLGIDGKWALLNSTWNVIAQNTVEVSAGWHNFTIVCGDYAGGYGTTDKSPFPSAFPLGVSINGGAMLKFNRPTFAFGDPTEETTGDFVIDRAGGVQFLTMKPGDGCRVVIDPTKSIVRLATAPTFGKAGQLALAPAFASATKGRFLLMSWDSGELELPEGVALSSLFDATSTSAAAPTLTLEPFGTGARLWLDLDPAAEKPVFTVLAIGDSITQGSANSYGTWRTFFARKMLAEGYDYRTTGFVDTNSQEPDGLQPPAAWTRHSGISGQRLVTTPDVAGLDHAAEAILEQAGDAVNAVLLLIGTNDLNAGVPAETLLPAWSNLVATIAARLPTAKIVCGTVLDIADDAKRTQIATFNAGLKALVEGGAFPAKQVSVADLHAAVPREDGNFYTATDLHPYWVGEEKLAAAYVATLKASLAEGAIEAEPRSVPTASGALVNVPEVYRGAFKRARVFNPLSVTAALGVGAAVPYEDFTNEPGAVDYITRVGYYIELKRKNTDAVDYQGRVRWLWVDMEAFGTAPGNVTIADVGVPLAARRFQQVVERLHVVSNVPGIESIAADDETGRGFIEFWPYTYSAPVSGVAGAPAARYGFDANDTCSGSSAYGSMQVHRLFADGTAATLFAYNRFTTGLPHEFGVGDFASQTKGSLDWTFTGDLPTMSLDAYEVARIEIWTRGLADEPQNDPTVATAYWLGGESGDPANNANWSCYNIHNQLLPGALPGKHTSVHINGAGVNLAVPSGTTLTAYKIYVDSVSAIGGDCDWRGLGGVVFADNTELDLKGHKLYLTSFDAITAGLAKVTDSVGGGELHVDVPQGVTLTNAKVVFAGQMKFVKDGPGTYIGQMQNQTYTGGTVVAAGLARPPYSGSSSATHSAKYCQWGPSRSTITVEPGAVFDIQGNYDYHIYDLILNGGTLANRGCDQTKSGWGCLGNITLTADSFMDVTRYTRHTTGMLDLGGFTLTANLAKTATWYFQDAAKISNGTIVSNAGWFDTFSGTSIDASTVTLVLNSTPFIGPGITLKDLINNWVPVSGVDPGGGGQIVVLDTFKPISDYFFRVTMQNGATIDLSDRTGTWNTRSLNANYQMSFVEESTIFVDVGARTDMRRSVPIVAWPTTVNAETQEVTILEPPETTVFRLSPRSKRKGEIVRKDDGLYFHTGLTLILK